MRNIPTIRIDVETQAMKFSVARAVVEHENELEEMIRNSIDASVSGDNIQKFIDQKVDDSIKNEMWQRVSSEVRTLISVSSAEFEEMIWTSLSRHIQTNAMRKRCYVCSAMNNVDAKFCRNCGKTFESHPQIKICSECGNRVDTTEYQHLFCDKCGGHIQQ